VLFRRGVEYRATESLTARIASTGAAAGFRELSVEFDPAVEEIYLNELRVVGPGGVRRSEGEASGARIEGGAGPERARLVVPVPGLGPGSTVELQVTRRALRAPARMPFLRHLFSSPFPVGRATLVVTGDVSQLVYRSLLVPPPEEQPWGLVFEVQAPPLLVREPHAPAPDAYLPSVWIADGTDSWQELARSRLGEIGDGVLPDAATAAVAAELGQGASVERRIRLLGEAVQRQLGPARPEAGEPTGFQHAVLLSRLLAAAGVPAFPALVSRRHRLQPELPSLAQFDHAVVHTPGVGGYRYLDVSHPTYASSGSVPPGLGGRSALILDPENPRVERMPVESAPEQRVELERHVRIVDADLEVNERVACVGYPAFSLRVALAGRSPTEQLEEVRRRMGRDGDVELLDVAASGLDAGSEQVQLVLRYRLRDALQPAGSGARGALPVVWERILLGLEPADGRRAPFELPYPVLVTSRVVVDLPFGTSVLEPRSAAVSRLETFGSWAVEIRNTTTRLELAFEALRPAARGGAADYATARATMESALSAAGPELSLQGLALTSARQPARRAPRMSFR